MENKQMFNPISVSSKFAICGLPLRCDTYKTCSFNCAYCFSNHRKVMEFRKILSVANLSWLQKKLVRIYDKQDVDTNNYLDVLLRDRITWHCGGMSDSFQPMEKELGITNQMLKITNQYGISILFSTKTHDLYHYENLNPELHTFQLSVTNLDDRIDLEPNVASIYDRAKLFLKLKDAGFRVGIRIQPFIPGVSEESIVDIFKDADYFTIEGLKLVPQNKEQKEYLLKTLALDRDSFTQMGLLNLKPEIRLKLYSGIIKSLENYGIPYSIADNDLHYISKTKCCCGEPLVTKSTDYNTTALLFKNLNYNYDDVVAALGSHACCKCSNLFTSNRQDLKVGTITNERCVTVGDFYAARFNRKSSIFSKGFLYFAQDNKQLVN